MELAARRCCEAPMWRLQQIGVHLTSTPRTQPSPAAGYGYTTLLDFTGRVAVVTGAAQGIGAEVSRALAEYAPLSPRVESLCVDSGSGSEVWSVTRGPRGDSSAGVGRWLRCLTSTWLLRPPPRRLSREMASAPRPGAYW